MEESSLMVCSIWWRLDRRCDQLEPESTEDSVGFGTRQLSDCVIGRYILAAQLGGVEQHVHWGGMLSKASTE